MKFFLLIVSLTSFLMTGCYRNGLYVQEEWVDRDFLASSKVNTPDPMQAALPKGQRLLIGWDLPRSLFRLGPSLHISVWLWDNTVEEIHWPIERRRGAEAFFFPNEEPDRDRRILTYRVQVVTAQGEILKTWEHHFWTQFIEISN